MSMSDRDIKYMKEMWGTTKLITDYPVETKVLQEVVYDPANKTKKTEDLYEDMEENDFSYGIEPTYKLNKGQHVL